MENDFLWSLFTKDLKKIKKVNKVFSEVDVSNTERMKKKQNIDLLLEYQLSQLKVACRDKNTTIVPTKKLTNNNKIDDKLDLHGLTLDQAYHDLKSFLTRNFILEKRRLIVVTGKGRLGTGGFEGKIRAEILKWFNTIEFQNLVLSYNQAPQRMGGEGAIIILLRKKN